MNWLTTAFPISQMSAQCQGLVFKGEDGSQTCRLACRDPSLARVIILSTCFLIAFARVWHNPHKHQFTMSNQRETL